MRTNGQRGDSPKRARPAENFSEAAKDGKQSKRPWQIPKK